MAAAAFWSVQSIRRRPGPHEEDYTQALIVPRRRLRCARAAGCELFAQAAG